MSSSSNESITEPAKYPTLEQLPEDFAIKLTSLSAIAISGEDQEKYLQGQVTCDVATLQEQQLLIGGHCDAKGKLLSVFRLIKHTDSLLLLQPSQSIEKSLTELKKFGVFAKVEITQSSHSFLGCLGDKSQAYIKRTFGAVPDELTPVIQANQTSIVYIAGNNRRYVIIDNEERIAHYAQDMQLPIYNDAVWRLLEITEGFPVLTSRAVQQYVPQMLNLDAIGGISFNKGCYLGQETVARMQYLGKNKKAMALFKGSLETASKDISLEKQIGENWRAAGDTLSYYQSDNGDCYVQAVIASDLALDTNIRFKQQPSSNVTKIALPYSTQ